MARLAPLLLLLLLLLAAPPISHSLGLIQRPSLPLLTLPTPVANSSAITQERNASLPAPPVQTRTRVSERLKHINRHAAMIGASVKTTAKLGSFYFLMYFFTVVYNISNKNLLTSFPHPVTVAALQVTLGIPMFLPIWALKSPQQLSKIDWSRYMGAATCHGLGNFATVYALFAGSVSFTHIVKAAEPLFSAALAAIVMKSRLSFESYCALLPVVVGVAVASAKEVSFSWATLGAAMASNFFYQIRMVLSKQALSNAEGTKLSASNSFRVVTLLSAALLLPLAVIFEASQVRHTLQDIHLHGETWQVLRELLISGASFYLYNEISFWILDLVHPVTLAVGNAIKRVVLIAAAVLFFRTPLDPIGGVGAAIAVAGSFLYALAAQRS